MTTMTRENFYTYAEWLAKHLGRTRGESWTAVNLSPRDHPQGVDVAGGIARLHLSIRHGRLVVDGLGPEGYRLKRGPWSRTFALDSGDTTWPAWDALRVAREVDRHIISAGYIDDLLVANARKAEGDRLDAEHARWISEAAALFEVGLPGPDVVGGSQHKLYLGKFVSGSGYVETDFRGGRPYMNINLSGIPAEVALAMLAQLAEHVGQDSQCCRTYGPGHHPDLAAVGCLRQKSDRGRNASVTRMIALLQGHGATVREIELALSEAEHSCYKVSVIERDGQTLAVVSWDEGSHGEFTVELARQEVTA